MAASKLLKPLLKHLFDDRNLNRPKPTRTATGVPSGKESESGAIYGLGVMVTVHILVTLSMLVLVTLVLALELAV
jgi:hypothetical protein